MKPIHIAALSTTLCCALSAAPGFAQGAQPTLVEDLQPGPLDGYPDDLLALNGRVFFVADDGVHGREPWISDGTAAGTFMLGDLEPGSAGSDPFQYVNLGGEALFFSSSNELWKSDGTPGGTVPLHPFVASGGIPLFMREAGGVMYFTADDGVVGKELWKTDGTVSGTVLVKDILPGVGSGITHGTGFFETTVVGSRLYLAADNGINGVELWQTNGTNGSTVMVADVFPGPVSSSPYFLTTVGNYVWFRAQTQSLGTELVRFNTLSSSVVVFDLSPGDSNPFNLTEWNSTLYFGADDGVTGKEPYKIEFNNALSSLGDLRPGPSGSLSSFGPRFQPLGGRLYFIADDGLRGIEPWSTDGTPAGTVQLRDLESGGASSSPHSFQQVGSEVFFVATVGGERELWHTDGTGSGTVPYFEVLQNGSSEVAEPTTSGSKVFLRATDGLLGRELYCFDAQLSGVAYCSPGTSSQGCQVLIAAAGIPSIEEGADFWITGSTSPAQVDGILFFGTNGRQASPWGNGTSLQCVVPPVKRTDLRSSGGSGSCVGQFSIDFNAWMDSYPKKAPTPGDVVQAEWWYRDAKNTSNQTTSMSDALEFTVCP